MKKRILSFILAICLIIPCALAFTACGKDKRVASELTTNIGEFGFEINRSSEFTITTKANDYADIMVYGICNFSDEKAISRLEYKVGGVWGDYTAGTAFGPENGFAMSDATIKFRATFNKTGEYTFTAFIKTVDGNVELCRTEVAFTVGRRASEITTNIGEKQFTAYEEGEFSFYEEFDLSITANDDNGKRVDIILSFSNKEAIDSFEYCDGDQWYQYTKEKNSEHEEDITDEKIEFCVTLSEESMTDVTRMFRVTFNTAGEYTFTAVVKTVDDVDDDNDDAVELCRFETTFTVNSSEPQE